MARIGKFLKTKIEDFIFHTIETRLGYNQIMKPYAPAGIESIPVKNDRVVAVKIDGTGKYAAVGVLVLPHDAQMGDLFLYSRNDDAEPQAIIRIFKEDKKIEVNGKKYGGIVKAPELKDQLAKMTGRIDAIIDAIQNGSTVPEDGGATYKSTMSAKVDNLDKEDFSAIESEYSTHGEGFDEDE